MSPNSQNTTEATSVSVAKNSINVVAALNSAPIAIPARITASGESPLHFARKRIIKIPKSAPIKAKVVVRYGLFINTASVLLE